VKHLVNTSGSWTEDNTYTRYAHLDDINGSNNQPIATFYADGKVIGTVPVNAGVQIGHMGERGASFNHLHFEVRGYNYQFYAVNPLRFLPRSQDNDYNPQIVTGLANTSCNPTFNSSDPTLFVTYRADTNEPDIQKVTVKVTDVCTTGQPSVTKTMHVERKEGITIWDDVGGDCKIKETASSYTDYTTGDEDEYFPNYTQPGITPIFTGCGSTRNHFNWNSSQYSMEVRFDNLGISGTRLRLEADVTDIGNVTVPADPVVPCTSDTQCQAIDDYNDCTCEAGADCEASSRGSSLSCSSAPCDQKAAACQGGKCVVIDEP
jgi:hypothetical protein